MKAPKVPSTGEGMKYGSDDVGFDLAVLVEQNVAHVADLLAVAANHIGALELGRQILIGLLHHYEIRGPVGAAGLGLVRRGRCRRGRFGTLRHLRKSRRQHERRQCRAEHQFLGHGSPPGFRYLGFATWELFGAV